MESTKHVPHCQILFSLYLLDGLRIVNPRCALFTALKKEQTVSSGQEISSDNNVAAFEEVSSCNCTESAPSAGQHVDYQTTEQCWNSFHFMLQALKNNS